VHFIEIGIAAAFKSGFDDDSDIDETAYRLVLPCNANEILERCGKRFGIGREIFFSLPMHFGD